MCTKMSTIPKMMSPKSAKNDALPSHERSRRVA